jgi:hypothetical protein
LLRILGEELRREKGLRRGGHVPAFSQGRCRDDTAWRNEGDWSVRSVDGFMKKDQGSVHRDQISDIRHQVLRNRVRFGELRLVRAWDVHSRTRRQTVLTAADQSGDESSHSSRDGGAKSRHSQGGSVSEARRRSRRTGWSGDGVGGGRRGRGGRPRKSAAMSGGASRGRPESVPSPRCG